MKALFYHWTDIPDDWMKVCPSFQFDTDLRMVSSDGSFLYDSLFLERLQLMRDILDQPMRINCLYRNPVHNARTPGSSPLSMHIEGRAADIDLRGRDREAFYLAALEAGMSGLGFYNSFLHVDDSRRRFWYGSSSSKKTWASTILGKSPFDL